ncbi:hypothetical protein JCM10908_003472 [Rhodotorula pacifica]|uniref:Rts2p n=1 Tax=Rhodotorula pacifica TaxID=1495444 RepID=UPI00316AFC56
MPKAEAGSAKALANKMKSKGLQKLRWYCQVCEKQCRDENGFKCHTMSESHLRQMLLVGESAGKHIADYTSRFQSEFVALLSRRWGTKRVRVNQVYQEYITDKNHLHMNATRFLSLTEFAKHLGRTGICHVDETEKGWWIQWIDNSPRALAKAEANQKKERGDMDDEMRQRKLIQEQIERAREEGERRRREIAAQQAGDGDSALLAQGPADEAAAPEISNELKRDEGEKLSLSLSFKAPSAAVPAATASTSTSASKEASPSGSASPPSAEEPSTDATPTSEPAAPAAAAAPPAPPKSTFIAPPPKPVIGFTPKANPFAAKPNPLKANPLKKPNPLKGSSGSGSGSGSGAEKRKAPMSAMEQIAMEEMARKQRRMA